MSHDWKDDLYALVAAADHEEPGAAKALQARLDELTTERMGEFFRYRYRRQLRECSECADVADVLDRARRMVLDGPRLEAHETLRPTAMVAAYLHQCPVDRELLRRELREGNDGWSDVLFGVMDRAQDWATKHMRSGSDDVRH